MDRAAAARTSCGLSYVTRGQSDCLIRLPNSVEKVIEL